MVLSLVSGTLVSSKHLKRPPQTVWQCFASLFEKGTVEVTSVL